MQCFSIFVNQIVQFFFFGYFEYFWLNFHTSIQTFQVICSMQPHFGNGHFFRFIFKKQFCLSFNHVDSIFSGDFCWFCPVFQIFYTLFNYQGFPSVALPIMTASHPVSSSILFASWQVLISPFPITGMDTSSLHPL